MPIINENFALGGLCKELANIYMYKNEKGVEKGVYVSDFPMFRWLQFVNDVTILSEEIRRERYTESIKQVSCILGRFLDFIGTYINKESTPSFSNNNNINNRWKVWLSFSELLATAFNLKSYNSKLKNIEKLPEGLTRWILAKYPFVCAKCGEKPCVCVVKPWVFENRREEPGPYKDYKNNIEDKIKTLSNNITISEDIRKEQNGEYDFFIKGFFNFFKEIYRNSYHKAEIGKIFMHLNEEVGEATIELTKLELIWLSPSDTFNKGTVEDIIGWSEAEIEKKTQNIRGEGASNSKAKIKKQQNDLYTHLRDLVADKKSSSIRKKLADLFGNNFNKINGKPEDWLRFWFIYKISEKFKEELADIASWIVAISCKLCEIKNNDQEGKEVITQLLKIYTHDSPGHTKLRCRACNNSKCTNSCLVVNSCGKELVEHAMML